MVLIKIKNTKEFYRLLMVKVSLTRLLNLQILKFKLAKVEHRLKFIFLMPSVLYVVWCKLFNFLLETAKISN